MSAQKTQADFQSAAGTSTFTFGVSGHRDTREEDSPELQKQIRTVFDRFRLAYSDAAFELLSPLADGADRIAAEVALRVLDQSLENHRRSTHSFWLRRNYPGRYSPPDWPCSAS